jgi:cysteine synthase B
MAEPRRVGQGSRRRPDDSRRRSDGPPDAEPHDLDATSGNTGIAYAMVGAARGYSVKLCMPENASPERKMILRALGAELVLTNPLESTDGAIREARRLYAEDPDRYFYPDQYNNPANWQAHYDTTAPESSSRPAVV